MTKIQERITQLAGKKIWLAVVLSLLLPLAGYLYTKRWKALGLMCCLAACLSLLSNFAPEGSQIAALDAWTIGTRFGTVYAPVDNWFGIIRARQDRQRE